MRAILPVILVLFSTPALAQVDMSQKEQIEKQREQNRQQDALRDSAVAPNAPSAPPAPVVAHVDSDANFEVDHSALGYSMIFEGDNPLAGFKFSGAFTAGFYQEQKRDMNYRIIGGVELPLDIELPFRRAVPFAGGGVQVGSKTTVYVTAGIDFRFVDWFKLQVGAHYGIGKDFGAVAGAALTWE